MAGFEKKGYFDVVVSSSSGIKRSSRPISCALLARIISVYKFPSLSIMSRTTPFMCRFIGAPPFLSLLPDCGAGAATSTDTPVWQGQRAGPPGVSHCGGTDRAKSDYFFL